MILFPGIFALLAFSKFDPAIFKAGAAARRHEGSILVDVENLRGKSGFGLSHQDILESLTKWTDMCDLRGRVSLVVDHGSEPSGYWLEDRGLAVVFAGKRRKADDVIAEDVGMIGGPVMVVTSDNGLIDRCQRTLKGVSILSPVQLLDDLDKILSGGVTTGSLSDPVTGDDSNPEITNKLDYEIRIGSELLQAEALLRSKRNVNNKRKKKLKAQVRSLREKLSKNGPSMLDRVTDVLSHGRQSTRLGDLEPTEQNVLLSRWEQVRRTSNSKERTGDRVILAEKLRRELEEQYGSVARNGTMSPSQTAMKLAMAHGGVQFVATEADDEEVLSDSLRLVVVSDTHGYERALTPDGSTLPEGDVLLHLGDFGIDHGPVKESLEKFDTWLAEQPHPRKIVVRGNHDPRAWYPFESGATFITRPTTLSLGRFNFAFMPYLSGTMSLRAMPRGCDVMVSHVPPRNVLDKTFTGKHAGNTALRRGVERMKTNPPALWLCGHIHEARGTAKHIFCAGTETLVVNAANANSGIAERIDHGPVVLQLSKDDSGKKIVDVVSMDNEYVPRGGQETDDTFFGSRSDSTTRDLLLAVDLGLRTGFSLFNDKGQLVRYENFVFDSPQELREAAVECLSQWEVDANADDSEHHQWEISHIAIEGADVGLREIWREVADERAVLTVRPSEWRGDLLSNKEKLSGKHAKEASRLIARQIVSDFGGKIHEGKFRTDVAESVLLGFHVSRRLGWISREPAVRRYTNGGVVVPEKAKSETIAAV